MPPKRTLPTSRTPRKRREVASSVKAGGNVLSAYPILSATEKRQLILAHAAMRGTRDPVQLASLWAGVAISFIVIVTAWGWTFLPGVTKAMKDPMPEFNDIVSGAMKVTQEAGQTAQTSDLSQEIQRAAGDLSNLSKQASAQQVTLDRLAQSLNATSTTSTTDVLPRTDVFRPNPTQPAN